MGDWEKEMDLMKRNGGKPYSLIFIGTRCYGVADGKPPALIPMVYSWFMLRNCNLLPTFTLTKQTKEKLCRKF